MLSTQNRMSDSSTQTEEGGVDALPAPRAIQFDVQEYKYFEAEIATVGNDVVYHFWPPEGKLDFPPFFAVALEGAFRSVLPEDADVRAEYMNRTEASAFMRVNDSSGEGAPVPTYYVRVIGWGDHPMTGKFLKDQVFRNLCKDLDERI